MMEYAQLREDMFVDGTKLLKEHEKKLCQENGELFRRKIDNITDEHERNSLWYDIIYNNEPGDVRNCFHLNYVFSHTTQKYRGVLKNKKIAIIAHVNYTNLITHCFEYIRQIPSSIDVYVTTKGEENIRKIQLEIDRWHLSNVKIVVPKDRGREISAFLVACKDVLMKYKYLCFVHDKQKNKGQPYQTIGQSFMDVLWENSIKNECYIENVIGQLENESRLGFLSPPAPYTSAFFAAGAVSWTSPFNYSEAFQLVERLELNCVIKDSKHPFALGTTFWCKTEALKPLFMGDLTYEDFSLEPMPLDGTISHAIERIFPYVAQSQGYYSGIMMTTEYASLYKTNYRYMQRCLVQTYINNQKTSKFADVKKYDERLFEICNNHKKVYIYGAGLEAKRCVNVFVNKYRIDIQGLVVSSGHRKENYMENIPIYEIDEVDAGDDVLIILALNVKNRREVKPQLVRNGFKNIETYIW